MSILFYYYYRQKKKKKNTTLYCNVFYEVSEMKRMTSAHEMNDFLNENTYFDDKNHKLIISYG